MGAAWDPRSPYPGPAAAFKHAAAPTPTGDGIGDPAILRGAGPEPARTSRNP